MFTNKHVVGGVVIASFFAIFALLGPTNVVSPFINTASAGYGGSSSSTGIQRVTICYNGQTKRVPRSQVPSYLAKGATKMKCATEQPITDVVTTTPKQAEIIKAQKQIILILQQMLTLLKAQN